MTVSMSENEFNTIVDILKGLGVDFDAALCSRGVVHVTTHGGHIFKVSEQDLVKCLNQVETKLGTPAKLVIKTAISKFC